jgi:hypothetical protein
MSVCGMNEAITSDSQKPESDPKQSSVIAPCTDKTPSTDPWKSRFADRAKTYLTRIGYAGTHESGFADLVSLLEGVSSETTSMERAKVVAWLRDAAGEVDEEVGVRGFETAYAARGAADAIERGAHDSTPDGRKST